VPPLLWSLHQSIALAIAGAKACFAIKLHATPQFSFPIAPFAVVDALISQSCPVAKVKTI